MIVSTSNPCRPRARGGRQRRRSGLVAAIALCVLLGGCDKTDQARLADGRAVPWEQWQGRWLLVNYWAEWCAPCRREIPELNRLHAEAGDAGVVVLGVNFDGLSGPALTTLMTRMGIRFPVLVADPGGRWDQAPPSVLPSTLVIAPDGALRDVLVGPQSYESLARAVRLTSEM